MTLLALQPASGGPALGHYADTIDGTVPISTIEPYAKGSTFERLLEIYPDGEATVWGGVGGNRSKIAKLSPGDVVWFYRTGEFISKCEVTNVVLDAPRLANAMWDPDEEKGSFQHVFFLTKPEEIRIPWSPVRSHLGYADNYWPQSLHVLDWETSRELISLFDSGVGGEDEDAQVATTAVEIAREGKLAGGQTYETSAEVRKAVEVYAVRVATAYFKVQGYEVKEKGAPYDLLCTKGEREIYVEVKGTQSPGKTVFLTKNEVALAQDEEVESALFLQHSVSVDRSTKPVTASGGHTHVLWPWDVNEEDLLALQYRYEVTGR